ncbi:hypothetical protein CPB84DRAFT_1723568 [Gymnopilus junonius]|uniref:DUF427 domain-containing protein n=1 Tax=Gymnopilus junonius TaxID=109634 RepID=A0A9P5TT14_GYMJU|nr:hypothetical protein CPB84DRAFT_1723568 [Gymnopilus junonius]
MNMFLAPLPHIEDCRKRIRVYSSGVCLIDTKKARLVWLHDKYPVYGFTREDLPTRWYLRVSSETEDEIIFDITLGHNPNLERIITYHLTGPLQGIAIVKFDAIDAWFEEDEQIFVHPKDPYKRVDVLQSSRHIRIELNGIEIAKTHAPRLLYETGLPVRTYIPKTDCRMDLWQPSDLKTACPYKGNASYYHVVLSSGETFENIVWWYPTTTLEAASVSGYVAFYDEKVDMWVDDEKQERPKLA